MASDLENWTLDKWLKRVGLRKYKPAFIDNGYETADLCANLNKADLDAIGVTNKQHRGSLFTHARKLLELVDKESFLASEEIVEKDEPGSRPKTKAKSPKLSTRHTPPPPATPPPPTNPPPPSASSAAQLAPLPDYSEPWNSKAISPAAVKNGLKMTVAATTPGDSTDGLSPVHSAVASGPVSGSRKKPPTSPGAELPAYKREGSAGTTRTKLQLKLKIREELFARGVVLTEPPYCWEDGSPDEQQVMDLAAELAEKFGVESLEMFDALKEVWSNANKSDFAVKTKAKEPFDTIEGASPTTITPPPLSRRTSLPTSPAKPAKTSFTLPATNGCYDEPFDTMAKGSVSPEKKKVVRVETSQTLPSPSRQRRSVDDTINGQSGHSPAKHSRFRLFKRKEKARSQSVRESDIIKQGMLSFPMKSTSPVAAVKHVSAENISDMGVAPSVDQMAYLMRGVPPPVPSPQPQQAASESSEDSDKTPPSAKTKVHRLAENFETIIRIRAPTALS